MSRARLRWLFWVGWPLLVVVVSVSIIHFLRYRLGWPVEWSWTPPHALLAAAALLAPPALVELVLRRRSGTVRVVRGGLDDPRVQALLEHHTARSLTVSGRGSDHALDAAALRAPDIAFWSAWAGEAVVGIGALKWLSDTHGEIKSMHTAEDARGRGVASAILHRIVAHARELGLERLSLETGSQPYFAPARAFYERHGFRPCPPFGDYGPDPASVFMTAEVGDASAPRGRTAPPAGPPASEGPPP